MRARGDLWLAGALALIISIVVALGKEVAFGGGAGIQVTELAFVTDPIDGPAIRQVRTVEGERPVAALWTASIRRQDTDEMVCRGGGAFRYPVGLHAPVLPIDQWVGDQGCWARIPPGVRLQACAEYEVADNQAVTACSIAFRRD